MLNERKKGVITKTPLSASISIDLKEKLTQIAKNERLSYSEITEVALMEYVQKLERIKRSSE